MIVVLAILAFCSCNKKDKKTLAEIQSEVIKYCSLEDSVTYQFSEERTGIFKVLEDGSLFVKGNKEDQGLIIEAIVDKKGNVNVVSQKVLTASKTEDYKKRIENLMRAFYSDICEKEPR